MKRLITPSIVKVTQIRMNIYIQNSNFATCFEWVWNVVCNFKGRAWIARSGQENVWNWKQIIK